MIGYEVILREDKVIYKTLGEFETPEQFEETLPRGFEWVSYNNIFSSDWKGHMSLLDAQVKGLPASPNDHFKYVVNGRLYTLADEPITAKWYGSFSSDEPVLPLEVQ